MPNASRPKLEIVRKGRRILPRLEDFVVPEPGAQGALFPLPKHGVLIFVHCSEVREDEFLKTIEYARPCSVVDLRDAPRFDIGSLNRIAVFNVFEKLDVNYIDIHSYTGARSEQKNVLSGLIELLRSTSINRPIMFLLGAVQSSVATGDDVLRIMTDIGKKVDEVYEVPSITTA